MRSYAQMSSTSSRVASANDEMLVFPSSSVIARLLASTIGTHVNDREQRPDRHCLFLVDVYLVEDPRRRGRELCLHLLGLDDREHVALLNTVPDRLDPLDDGALLHSHAPLGKADLGHGSALLS